MKVLIIGGTGFIGKHVTQMFVENGHQVAVFHRNKNTFWTTLNVAEIIGDKENIFNFKKQFHSFKPELVLQIICSC
jgi:nucleoside-diphosphate-sugar epimerase